MRVISHLNADAVRLVALLQGRLYIHIVYDTRKNMQSLLTRRLLRAD